MRSDLITPQLSDVQDEGISECLRHGPQWSDEQRRAVLRGAIWHCQMQSMKFGCAAGLLMGMLIGSVFL